MLVHLLQIAVAKNKWALCTMWSQMARRIAMCCSYDPVIMYEKLQNKQLPSPVICLIIVWVSSVSRDTFGLLGLSLLHLTKRIPKVEHALSCHCLSTTWNTICRAIMRTQTRLFGRKIYYKWKFLLQRTTNFFTYVLETLMYL